MLRERTFSGILHKRRHHLIITHLVRHLVVRLGLAPEDIMHARSTLNFERGTEEIPHERCH